MVNQTVEYGLRLFHQETPQKLEDGKPNGGIRLAPIPPYKMAVIQMLDAQQET